MNISIIVPVFNEKANLQSLIEQILAVMLPLDLQFEAILIDDGSTDGSRDLLRKLSNIHEPVKAVLLKRNYGQTAALMAGFEASKGEVIVPIDADLQNDPADIPKLLSILDSGFDVVSGWRRDRKDNALFRTIPSRLANLLISCLSGVKLHDYGCSLKAYRRHVIEDVRLYGEMHRFIPIYATWQGARVTEVEVRHHPRRYGKSKYGLNRTLKVILDLLVVKFMAKYFEKPIYVFGGFSLFCLAGSTVVGFLAIYYKYWGGKTFVETPLPLLCVLLFIVSMQCLLTGLIVKVLMRTYYESQQKKTYLVAETLGSTQ